MDCTDEALQIMIMIESYMGDKDKDCDDYESQFMMKTKGGLDWRSSAHFSLAAGSSSCAQTWTQTPTFGGF